MRDHAFYLGYPLGPTGGSAVWTTCQSKFRDRVQTIAQAHPPTAVAARLWNQRAVLLVSYLAQFAPLSKPFARAELGLVHRLLHLPGNCLCGRSAHALAHAGGPYVASLQIEAHAVAARAALQTFDDWQRWLPLFKQLRAFRQARS